MKIFKSFIIISMALFTFCSYAENQNSRNSNDAVILEIIIPLDKKGDTETGHTAIEYHLQDSGFAYDVHNVYNWAHQASRNKQLKKEELEEIINLVKKLPASKYEGEKDESLIIKFYSGENQKIIKYKQDNLPKDLERIFELLGGIRLDLKDRLIFNL